MKAADRLLQGTVDANGRVDYAAAIAGRDLDAAETELAAAVWPTNDADRYAFLLNAYNVATVSVVRRRLMRDGRVVRSTKNPVVWLQFFLFTRINIGNRRMSLFWLEFRHIKPHLRRDPRGHFALVCGSESCPPLRDGIFHGETLDAELDLAARAFVQPPGGYRLEPGILYLNRIFKWYRRDFAAIGNLPQVWEKYAPATDVERASGKQLRIKFLPYDWSVNTS